MRAFLDDTAQIIGPVFSFDKAPEGRSERETAIARFILDKAKTIYEAAEKLGGVKSMNLPECFLQHVVYLKKYSRIEEGGEIRKGNGTEGIPEEERKLREAIVAFGNRLVEENLVQGTWGNISARLNEKEMLVTPSGVDYDHIEPGDIMKVEIATLQYAPNGNLKPTSEKNLHGAVYASRPDVGAIVHTHSTYCSVYAAAEQDHPMAKLADYGIPGSRKLAENTASALGSGIGAIMAHHGMIAVGADLEAAFSNAVLLEDTAKSALA